MVMVVVVVVRNGTDVLYAVQILLPVFLVAGQRRSPQRLQSLVLHGIDVVLHFLTLLLLLLLLLLHLLLHLVGVVLLVGCLVVGRSRVQIATVEPETCHGAPRR